MSGRVDVLAVMDAVAEGMGGPTDLGLSDARAAVAELIAAATAYFGHYCQDEADDWFDEGESHGEDTGCTREQSNAARRLRAAIVGAA